MRARRVNAVRRMMSSVVVLAVAVGAPALACLVLASAATAAPLPVTFSSTGAQQAYTVPAGVTALQLVAIGAPGGAGFSNAAPGVGGAGADGARASATLAVTPGQVLYVEVGGAGGVPNGSADGTGGFNGGGQGFGGGGGGGGATDVRTVPCGSPCVTTAPASLSSRALVAAGGGGGGGAFANLAGGAGGGASANGSAGTVGQGDPCAGGGGGGATSAAGGPGGLGVTASACGNGPSGNGSDGALGQGGNGSGPSDIGGGGGGGYYGGGGGGGGSTAGGGGGGGGSSFGPAGAVFTADTSAVPSLTVTPIVPPMANVTPAKLAFATQAQGTLSPAQTVTVTNTGGSPLTLAGFTFTGADAGDFLVGSSTCQGAIASGQSCALTVRFAPGGTGARTAVLQIIGDQSASPSTVTLTGTGGPLPTGRQGATGPRGRRGRRGARGPRGSAPAKGTVQLLTCTTVTRTVTRHGHRVRIHRLRCRARQISGALRIVLERGRVIVRLTRGKMVYATGNARRSANGEVRVVLERVRRAPPGRYTLVLRSRHGGLWVTRRVAIRLR